jgi:hypothetical protein
LTLRWPASANWTITTSSTNPLCNFGNGKVNVDLKYEPRLPALAEKARTIEGYVIEVRGYASSAGSAIVGLDDHQNRHFPVRLVDRVPNHEFRMSYVHETTREIPTCPLCRQRCTLKISTRKTEVRSRRIGGGDLRDVSPRAYSIGVEVDIYGHH